MLTLTDREMYAHGYRVAALAVSVARILGLPDEALTTIEHGALLHDIGKLAVPEAVLRKPAPLTVEQKRDLWRRAGLTLGVYVIAFTWSLYYTSPAHVAVYLSTSPVWALMWEGRPERNWNSLKRYLAAALAMSGVLVLFWPKLHGSSEGWLGDLLAIVSSILWTLYSRQCRSLGATFSGAEITAHTMWRAAIWVSPLAVVELARHTLVWRVDLVLIQAYCVVGSGVIAFALWNNALRHWPTSQVILFGNLIPLSTMIWAKICLDDPVTPTFWPAMLLVIGGVILGQTNWEKIFGNRWLPSE